MWGCPHAGFEPQTADSLPPSCRNTLTAVACLTGSTGHTTCPLAELRMPWVRDIADQYAWWKQGQLELCAGYPSQLLVDAINAIRSSVYARELHELEVMKERAEQAATAARKPPADDS